MSNLHVKALERRVETLEKTLRARPTVDQIEYVMERNRRLESLYQAVLQRNKILRRKLDETEI